MQSYPLYEELKKTDLNNKIIDIKMICNTINNLNDINHYEEIAALIYHYSVINNINIDFKSIVGGKGMLYNMNNIPIELQKIIACYLEFVS